MLIFCWLCKTFLPPLADYLGLLCVQAESLQIIQEKNEKVVIPMHQEAWQDILQMHEMVPNYITWFLREHYTFILYLHPFSWWFNPATGVLPVRIHLCTIFWTIVWPFWWETRNTSSEEILSLVSSWICLSLKLQKKAHPIRINTMNDMMPWSW